MKRLLFALLLLGGTAQAQVRFGDSFRFNSKASLPANLVGGTGWWSNSSNGNHPTLHLSGLDYDLLNCTLCTGNANSIGGFPVSTSTPSSGLHLIYNGSSWTPRLLAITDLSTPGLIGNGASQVPAGNDVRFAPVPATLGNQLVDNVTGYVSQPQQNYDVRNYASFSAAVTAIGSTPATLAVSTTQTVSASVSLPSTLTLTFTGAGKLSIASGQVVTINGGMTAPATQIFTGSGTVSFTQTASVWSVLPQWWGAVGDGSTVSGTAIQAAANSIRDRTIGGVVTILNGSYSATAQIALVDTAAPHSYANISIEGQGYGSQIVSTACLGNGAGGTGLFYFHGTSAYSLKNVGVRRVRITGCDETTTVGPLITFSNTDGSYVQDAFLDTSRDEGIYWNDPSSEQNTVADNVTITHVGGWNAPIASDLRSAFNINSTNARMTNCRAFQNGIAVEQTGSGVFVANRIDGCGYNNPLSGGTYYTCMSMESTSSANGKFVVSSNLVRNGNLAIGLGATSTGEMIISDNIIELCNSGITLNNVSVNAVVRGNIFYDTLSGSQGSAITRSSGTLGALIEGNTFIRGTTAWATVYLMNDTSAADIVRGNLVVGDAVTSQVFKAVAGNTATEFIDNTIQGGAMPAGRTRYQWQGVNFTATTFSGIDTGTVLSTKRRSLVAHSAAPTTGTWSLGDTTFNTSPTATGIDKWVVTSAGTPGTWTAINFVPPNSSVTNAMLANSSVTVNTTSPLGGGGAASLGGSALALTCSTCIVSGDVHLLPTPPATGAVLYSNGSNWVSLAAGSGSQFLQGGTTPSWAVPAGSGTVTSVTCGTDLTGGTITTTGTCALNSTIGQAITHSASVTFQSHIIGTGGAPSVVVQTAQCGGSCTGSATGSDIAFEVTLQPSGTQAAGVEFKVTPAVTWGAVPYCVLHPSNSLARSNGSYDLYFDRAASSTSSLFFSLTTSVLVSTSTYKWIIHCTQ